jgi:hypothetical protein
LAEPVSRSIFIAERDAEVAEAAHVAEDAAQLLALPHAQAVQVPVVLRAGVDGAEGQLPVGRDLDHEVGRALALHEVLDLRRLGRVLAVLLLAMRIPFRRRVRGRPSRARRRRP